MIASRADVLRVMTDLTSLKSFGWNDSVQSLSHVWLFATPQTEALQASLSITNSQSLLKLISIKLVIPSNHLTLCPPILLPPSGFFQWVNTSHQVAKVLEIQL